MVAIGSSRLLRTITAYARPSTYIGQILYKLGRVISRLIDFIGVPKGKGTLARHKLIRIPLLYIFQ